MVVAFFELHENVCIDGLSTSFEANADGGVWCSKSGYKGCFNVSRLVVNKICEHCSSVKSIDGDKQKKRRGAGKREEHSVLQSL